ncbi:MAG: hypothetical protein GQ531_06975 [Sulfurovum sp.]|nr:hypothetical protein [Sulfurovum sp.]
MFTVRSFSKTLCILLLTNPMYAALPPGVQDDKDLQVMQNFVQSHPKVSSTLRFISLSEKKVYFAKNCEVTFKRAFAFHLPGWVGPAEDLVFKSATCPID